MKQILSMLAVLVIATMITSLTFAQVSGGSPRVNGIAVDGNTTIVFAAADDSDLQMDLLRQWSGFAQQHPKIAYQLGNKPILMGDAGYLRKHPELAKLFADNPNLLAADEAQPRQLCCEPIEIGRLAPKQPHQNCDFPSAATDRVAALFQRRPDQAPLFRLR